MPNASADAALRPSNCDKVPAAGGWPTRHCTHAFLGWGESENLRRVNGSLAPRMHTRQPTFTSWFRHVSTFILVANNHECALQAEPAADVAIVRFNHCADGSLKGGSHGRTDLLVLRATHGQHLAGITKDGKQLQCTLNGGGTPKALFVVAGTLPHMLDLPDSTLVEVNKRSRYEYLCWQEMNRSASHRSSCSTGLETYAFLRHINPRAAIALQGFDGHKDQPRNFWHNFSSEEDFYNSRRLRRLCNESEL